MRSETDEQLLDRLRSGDGNALAAVYERHKVGLFNFCARLLGDRQKAEDAVHDTFVKLSDKIGSLEKAGSFRSWLFCIARNEALMQLRRERKTDEVDPESVSDDTTPLSSMERAETQQIIREHLAGLKCEYREVVLLREFEQLSYHEIAGVTGATVSSVKSRLFKARKALTASLAVRFNGGKDL